MSELVELCEKIDRHCRSIRLATKIIIGECIILFLVILPYVAHRLLH